MFNIKTKKVTIIGLARSGIAVANAVGKLGGIPKISEFKPKPDDDAHLEGLDDKNIAIEYGGHTRAFIEDSHFMVLSPGVRGDIEAIKWAKNRGIEVLGEIEFAFRFCPCPVIAVTGSNGKTTTSTLIAQIINKSGRRAALCGNIGSPFSKHVADLTPKDFVVLEISSFQLESTTTFRPHVAVWLNFSQNHLDRHVDLMDYFNAKKKIFAHQRPTDWAVLNAGQPELVEVAKTCTAEVVFFNEPDALQEVTNPNFAAAMAVAKVLDIPPEICRDVFAAFKGVEHRMEMVRTLRGVDYINDSKSTTAEAGRWALERIEKPVIMICGGRDKHIDFSVLRPVVLQKVKVMIAIGEARDIMTNTFGDIVPVETFTSFEEAIVAAQRNASSGDCVVLSPMCASFDMFKDYEHRGKVFKEIVNKLK